MIANGMWIYLHLYAYMHHVDSKTLLNVISIILTEYELDIGTSSTALAST